MNQPPKSLEKRSGATSEPGNPQAGVNKQPEFAEVAVRIMDAVEQIAFLLEQRALKDGVIDDTDCVYTESDGQT